VIEDAYEKKADIPKYEILLGDTNRAESAKVKQIFDEDTDWKIAVSGTKVVIVASTEMTLGSAVNRFVQDYIEKGEGLHLPATFTLSGKKGDESAVVEFRWQDGTESLIRRASWGPRVYTLSNGTMIAGYETRSGIKTMLSADGGKGWQQEASASFYPELACANVNLFEDGENLYLAYRAIGAQENGFYTSLQVSVSTDKGQSWQPHSTVVEHIERNGSSRGVWEPDLGLLNGRLVCFYANDSTAVTSMQNIEYVVWNGTEWGERTIVSMGSKHNSRDGMPSWTQLSTGEYVCVIESSRYYSRGYPFVIQLMYSKDGVAWSEPVDVYTPTTKDSKAGAPGIVELPNGQLVISFQTDEDATQKGDGTSVMKTIYSDGTRVENLTAANFSQSDNVFATPDGESSVWTGLWYHDGCLFAAAGTKSGSSLKKIELK
jgi:hypothetical protein